MRFTIAIMLTALVLGCGARNLRAEEANEAKEAADEEAAERKRANELDRPVVSTAVGVLQLKTEKERGDNKGVVGKLIAADREYTLKVSTPELINTILPFDGQRVKLQGNPRNKGKYFLIQGPPQVAQPKDK